MIPSIFCLPRSSFFHWHIAIGMMISLIMMTSLSGCAVLYFDAKTGTQHVVGFGHMKMRINPSRENVRATIFGIETIGISVGSSPGGRHASLGWQSLHSVEVMNNSAVRLEWITNDPFTISVGSYFPYTPQPTEERNESCIATPSF